MPDATASSTMYWMVGLSTIGNISFGWAFVAGKKRVPNPAAGIIAFLIFMEYLLLFYEFNITSLLYHDLYIWKMNIVVIIELCLSFLVTCIQLNDSINNYMYNKTYIS